MRVFAHAAFLSGLTLLSFSPAFADDEKKDPAKPDAAQAQPDKSAPEKSADKSDEKATSKSADQPDSKTANKQKLDGAAKPDDAPNCAFLGVYVSSAHPALANHFGELLSPEQGLVIEDFPEKSPAKKAGLKVHDVITTYDDQKLFSAEQLGKLVHSDKCGREVTIGYLRGGKRQTVKVALGEMSQDEMQAWHEQDDRGSGPHHSAHRARDHRMANSEWETFDSLTLKKLKDNKFQAEVQYLDKEGKQQKHTFEGTREEIRKAVQAEKDMKPAEKLHLLRSLNLPAEGDFFHWLPDFFDEMQDDSYENAPAR